MKKRFVSAILTGAMVLTLAACGGTTGGSTGGAASSTDAGGAASSTEAAGGAESSEAGSEASAEAGGDAAASGDILKIGVFQPLSGANAAYGTEVRDAAQLALEYINENGGFNGQQGELVVYDTQGSVEEAVKVAEKLINEDKCKIVIGPMNSSEMFAAGKSLSDAGVYTLGCGTSHSWMQEDWPYVFRCSVDNGMTPPTIAKMIKASGYESVSGFYGQDDASLSTYNQFEEACGTEGVNVLVSESYDQGDTDFSAQVARMLAANPDCVYISVNGETGPIIVKQLRQHGYNGIIFDKESFMAAQVEIAGKENSNYIAFANPYVTYDSVEDIDIPNVKEFAERYAAKYGDINKTDSAYRGWDAMLILWEATKVAGSNEPDALRDATHTISSLEGLGGNIDFTPGDREPYHEIRTFVLDNGKNIEWNTWKDGGGYDAFLSATGREK